MKTHCIRGHALTPDNVRVNKKGHRICRMCRRLIRKRKCVSNIRVTAHSSGSKPTDDMIADAARRSNAPRDITSMLCGDPPRGYSALDLRQSPA